MSIVCVVLRFHLTITYNKVKISYDSFSFTIDRERQSIESVFANLLKGLLPQDFDPFSKANVI